MIKFTQLEKRVWTLSLKKDGCEDIELNIRLGQSSLSNKFEVVSTTMDEFTELIPEFSDWYYDLLKKYIDSKYNSELVRDSAPELIEYAKQYISLKEVDFSSFVNRKKTSSTSILFDEEDIQNIAVTSTCLKVFSIFTYDTTLRVPENINKSIYNSFVSDCIEYGTTDKIFQLIRSRNFRSSTTDRYMWELIKLRTLEDPETSVMSVFNFFMTNLVSLLDVTQNPIYFLVKIVDDSLRWMMKEIYREKVIYDESYTSSEDVHGSFVHKDIFHVYCCNDLISKAAKLGMKLLEEEFEITDTEFIYLKERLDGIKTLDPALRLFTLPIISKVFNVPYNTLKTAPPKHIVLIGSLLYILGKNTLCKDYPVLSEFLLLCPIKSNTVISRSSYKLRDITTILKDDTPLFGIASKKLKYDIISPICGILNASKKNLINIVDGQYINKITYSDLEDDVIKFYTNLYANGLNTTFLTLQKEFDDRLF